MNFFSLNLQNCEVEAAGDGGEPGQNKISNNGGSLGKKMRAISMTMKKKMGKKYIKALSEEMVNLWLNSFMTLCVYCLLFCRILLCKLFHCIIVSCVQPLYPKESSHYVIATNIREVLQNRDKEQALTSGSFMKLSLSIRNPIFSHLFGWMGV